jgi:hypothetical protein
MEINELEFRGISLDNGKEVFGFPYLDIRCEFVQAYIVKGGFVPVKSMPLDRFTEVQSDSISQYIGIKDINGIKVFANDKVKVKLPDLPYCVGETIYGIIVYDSPLGRFQIEEYDVETKQHQWDYHNIHEDLKIEVIKEFPQSNFKKW